MLTRLLARSLLLLSIWLQLTTAVLDPGNGNIDFLFPFGGDVGDSLLQPNDDGVANMQLTRFFPYFDRAESNIFIANNGLLSFREALSAFSPQPFPNGVSVIAPFWADVDTRSSTEEPPLGVAREDIGMVWYREEFSSELLERAGIELREAIIGLSTFTPTSLFIATWSNVGYYNLHIDKLNTFQCVLVTDGILSFVIYLYPRNGIQWTTGDASGGSNGFGGTPAQVGFNAGDGVRFSTISSSRTDDVVNVDEGSNVRKPGIYIYQVDGTAVPVGCSDNADMANVFPLTGSAMGGTLLSISGPCFDEFSTLECLFGGIISNAVFATSLRAYCLVPMLNVFGHIELTITGTKQSGENISFPVMTFNAISLDYISGVEFSMPGVLLYSDGDRVILTWNPNNVLLTEIASQNDYPVTVEVYVYTSNSWRLFEELDTVSNTGTTVINGLKPGPVGADPIVPLAFHIKVADFVDLETYIRPIVQTGQAGIWSPVAYKITDPDYIAADQCAQFVQNQQTSGPDLLQKTISCPCRVNQARIGNSMFLEQRSSTAVQMRSFFYPTADTCFLSTILGEDGEGQECCFDSSGLLLTGPPSGGTVDRVASRLLTNPWDHYINDIIPQIHCCRAPTSSDSTCRMYYNVRPSDNCGSFDPTPPALLFSDPHMITLDGLQYTYNGAGEYVVLDALAGEFIFQARTEPAERVDGGIPVGTAFTAIAVRMRNSDVIELQRSTFRGLTILVNGARHTIPEQTEMSFNGVTLTSQGNSTVSLLFEGGLTILVQNRNNFLFIQIASLPISYMNNTEGLLGVWNGDPNDDLERPDGTVLSPNSTLQEIHESFGELWRIPASESLFTYTLGQSAATFDNPSFTPVFNVSELPFANLPGLADLCGDSLECIFDVGATGSIEVGQAVMEIQMTYNETVEVSQSTLCEPECQNGAACVSNDVCNCPPTHNGSRCENDIDECAMETHNCDQNCTNIAGGFSCSCPLDGYVLHMNEATCTDIDECSIDGGGCRCLPDLGTSSCSSTCTNTIGSFQCICNDGYQLDATNFICIDINECEVNNGGCQCDSVLEGSSCIATCINTNGSHSCSCNAGYQLTTNDKICEMTCLDFIII